MAIQNDISRISYTGNGSDSTPYPVPFYFFSDEDLRVYLTDAGGGVTLLTLGLDYSVTGAGEQDGGNVVTAVAHGAPAKITIAREVAAVQPLVYEENDKFPAKSHERGLDRLTMAVQQIARGLRRCFRLGDSQGDLAPVEGLQANALAGVDGNGAPKLYTIDQLLTLLSLPAPVLNFPQKTFADAGGRAMGVPDFIGQVGTQQDTGEVYVATAVTVGAWAASVPVLADHSIFGAKIANGTIGQLKLAPLAAASNLPSGAVIKSVSTKYSFGTQFTGVIPFDDTVPQISEGNFIMSATISPSFGDSKVRVRARLPVSLNEATDALVIAVFRNSVSDAITATYTSATGDGDVRHVFIEFDDSPETTSATTYSIRAGTANGDDYNINALFTDRKLGGASCASLVLEEVKS